MFCFVFAERVARWILYWGVLTCVFTGVRETAVALRYAPRWPHLMMLETAGHGQDGLLVEPCEGVWRALLVGRSAWRAKSVALDNLPFHLTGARVDPCLAPHCAVSARCHRDSVRLQI